MVSYLEDFCLLVAVVMQLLRLAEGGIRHDDPTVTSMDSLCQVPTHTHKLLAINDGGMLCF
jgi:hypothetical protein